MTTATATETSFQNLALSQVNRDYSVLFILYNKGELSCNWTGTNGFKVKAENEWFIVIAIFLVASPIVINTPTRA